ncbi:MAG: hypothetical protein Ct9H90mP7_2120 [Candidatus Neomarinimicrobiota bacterium]|nr:MAG: hypothetical protein Ct9H90mP7_2120 [Candidatus Neomarinimicrobiota bacterium]
MEETLTSGGFTSIFIFLHSFIKMTIRSMFDISLVRLALRILQGNEFLTMQFDKQHRHKLLNDFY